MRVREVLDFFSVGLLFGSLFAPYRQISAEQVQGNANDQLRALGDRIFSRAIGAVIRLMLIVTGLITALAIGLLGVILIAAWPLLPVLPIVGIFLIQGMS